jgi:hypothetical protein
MRQTIRIICLCTVVVACNCSQKLRPLSVGQAEEVKSHMQNLRLGMSETETFRVLGLNRYGGQLFIAPWGTSLLAHYYDVVLRDGYGIHLGFRWDQPREHEGFPDADHRYLKEWNFRTDVKWPY